jgi:hypothetical protein
MRSWESVRPRRRSERTDSHDRMDQPTGEIAGLKLRLGQRLDTRPPDRKRPAAPSRPMPANASLHGRWSPKRSPATDVRQCSSRLRKKARRSRCEAKSPEARHRETQRCLAHRGRAATRPAGDCHRIPWGRHALWRWRRRFGATIARGSAARLAPTQRSPCVASRPSRLFPQPARAHRRPPGVWRSSGRPP